MKNNKKIIFIVILNILIIGLICSFINIKSNVLKEKQVIKEMSESTQVSNLQTQINTLNKEHTDYANYIQTSKREIASAITDMGVATSENADASTMASNIRNIRNGVSDIETSIIYKSDSGSIGVSHEFTLQSDRQLLTMTISIYSLKSVTFNPTLTVKVNGIEVESTIKENYTETGTDYVYRFSVGSAFINACAGDVISVNLKQANSRYAYIYPIVCI